jgi:hypothetical protein
MFSLLFDVYIVLLRFQRHSKHHQDKQDEKTDEEKKSRPGQMESQEKR